MHVQYHLRSCDVLVAFGRVDPEQSGEFEAGVFDLLEDLLPPLGRDRAVEEHVDVGLGRLLDSGQSRMVADLEQFDVGYPQFSELLDVRFAVVPGFECLHPGEQVPGPGERLLVDLLGVQDDGPGRHHVHHRGIKQMASDDDVAGIRIDVIELQGRGVAEIPNRVGDQFGQLQQAQGVRITGRLDQADVVVRHGDQASSRSSFPSRSVAKRYRTGDTATPAPGGSWPV